MNKIKAIISFIKDDIWRIKTRKLSWAKSFWIKQLRILLLAVRGFAEDKCQLRASALTFYSLLSIVPVLAMAFGIAKGFGLDKILEQQLYEKIPGQVEVIEKIVGFANSFLENTQGGLIAGIGVGILFWTVIKVLGNIENSFNDIWGIKKARSLGRKFSDYLSIMLICPLLFIMSSSITVLITSQVTLIIQKVSLLGAISPVIMALLKLLPYGVIWIMFTFIYIFMPNTKVSFSSGLLGGIIAGTIYQVVQWAYIAFQVGVSKYGAIYGSFAALPLFLVWLQISWLIVLFGAEISFAEQNVDTYEFEPDCLKVSQGFKKLLALQITQLCVNNFAQEASPWTAQDISHHLELPIRLVNQVLYDLTEAGILSEVKLPGSQMAGFQPAIDIEKITIHKVLNILDNNGLDNIPLIESEELSAIKTALEDFDKSFADSPENKWLKDI